MIETWSSESSKRVNAAGRTRRLQMAWLRSLGIKAPAHGRLVPSGVHGRVAVAIVRCRFIGGFARRHAK